MKFPLNQFNTIATCYSTTSHSKPYLNCILAENHKQLCGMFRKMTEKKKMELSEGLRCPVPYYTGLLLKVPIIRECRSCVLLPKLSQTEFLTNKGIS